MKHPEPCDSHIWNYKDLNFHGEGIYNLKIFAAILCKETFLFFIEAALDFESFQKVETTLNPCTAK